MINIDLQDIPDWLFEGFDFSLCCGNIIVMHAVLVST